MLVTEEHAREKWCPMVRGKEFRPDDIVPSTPACRGGRCIGSDCMMWRWLDPVRDGTVLIVKSESYAGMESLRSYDPDARRGYCGLAKRPEAM